MSDVLCIYYSRTGNTKKAMEAIAGELDAELVALEDGVVRSGFMGWFRCGMDAMRKTTAALTPFETEKPLSQYRLVIVGTPIWAGRCSAVVREFLKRHGPELENVAFLTTRSGESGFQDVFDQMDRYVPQGHRAAVSLRGGGSVGYQFWQEDFLRQTRAFLAGKN